MDPLILAREAVPSPVCVCPPSARHLQQNIKIQSASRPSSSSSSSLSPVSRPSVPLTAAGATKMLASVGIFGFGQLSISFGGGGQTHRTSGMVCMLGATCPSFSSPLRPVGRSHRPPHKERGFSHAARLTRTHTRSPPARSFPRTAKIYGRRRRSFGRPHACCSLHGRWCDGDVLRSL